MRSARSKSLRLRALLATTLVVAGVASLSAYLIYDRLTRDSHAEVAGTLERFEASYRSRARIHMQDLELALHLLSLDEPAMRMFAARDREGLTKLLLPTYQNVMRPTYGITQFHFHVPPATSFLRLHRPSKFGDDLSEWRASLVQANRDLKTVSGIEVTRSGPGFKMVRPVIHQGAHVGSMELATKMTKILDAVAEDQGFDYALGVRDEVWDRARCDDLLTRGPTRGGLIFYHVSADSLKTRIDEVGSLNETTLVESNGVTQAVRGFPIKDFGGHDVGMLVVSRDVTQLLAHQERELRNTLVLIVAIAIVLSLGLILYLNVAVFRKLHAAAEVARAIGDGNYDVRVPVGRHDEVGVLSSALNDMVERLEQLRDSQDELVAARTEELAKSVRDLQSFTYSVSHDLRPPLRAISGFTEMLFQDYGDSLDDEGRRRLSNIRDAVERMSGMLEGLLSLSRITRRDIHRSSVNISHVARELVDALADRDFDRRVTVNIADGLRIDGDEGLITVALDNLLGNAWKFTRDVEDPVITVGVEELDGIDTIYVKDNGCGFDMAYANKLFQPFHRLHKPGRFRGEGIGLATVSRIAERHGGKVWAEAVVDEGATFYMTLSHNAPASA